MPSDSEEAEVSRVEDLSGLDLVALSEENPIITCEIEGEHCAYKREYENHLNDYNIEKLKRWPNCEGCDCPLVVVRDA